ncbi:unnamed protein product [Ixodes pacificus]
MWKNDGSRILVNLFDVREVIRAADKNSFVRFLATSVPPRTTSKTEQS